MTGGELNTCGKRHACGVADLLEVPRYRITFEIEAFDQDDAVHWAAFIARPHRADWLAEVVSVVRHVKIGDEGVDQPVIRADARRGIRLGHPQPRPGPY